MRQKRGQITLFIIAGLLLVLIIALLVYFQGQTVINKIDPQVTQQFTIDKDTKPLANYIEQCLKQVANPLIIDIAAHGGTLSPEFSLTHNDQEVNYFCTNENQLCKNIYLTKQQLEQELSQQINQNIKECIDLSIFEEQGFEITTKEHQTTTLIQNNKAIITLNFPITLTKQDLELSAQTFTANVEQPLGLLLKTAVEITNQELQSNQFDIVKFMKVHRYITIQRVKPYPHTLYSLTSNELTFNFALEGYDTVADVGYSYFGEQKQIGCCYNPQDNLCYKNTDQQTCNEQQGIYDQSCTCNNDALPTTSVISGKSCNENGVTYKHLDSWCYYESETGFGQDKAGSRHYVHYCYNGEIKVDACRDYREEFCAQSPITQNSEEKISAQCVINRWQDCITCDSQECCLDEQYRDCRWNDYKTQNKCTPKVSPGFKFWGANALAICTRANEEKACNGFTCSQEWIDNSATLCMQQGDCGAWYNYQNEFTQLGFFESDLSKSVSTNAFEQKQFPQTTLTKSQSTKRASTAQYSYAQAINAHAQMLSSAINVIDEVGTISFSDLLNPLTGKPAIEVTDFTYCGVWQAPFGNSNCAQCDDDPLHPCTQYKCKSLGQLCEFEYKNGQPHCFSQTISDKTPPQISFDQNNLSQGYEVEEQELKIDNKLIRGYKINPDLIPYETITFGIKTDEETKCRIGFTPIPEFTDLPAFNAGSNEFKTSHLITLNTPPSIEIPPKIKEVLNLSTVDNLLDFILSPQDVLKNYKQKYSTALFLYKTFNGDDLTKKIDPFVADILDKMDHITQQRSFARAVILNSLNKFNNNEYIVYVKCIDRAGNENMDNVFIEFGIDNSGEDSRAPRILTTNPLNNSQTTNEFEQVFVFTNEHATCKYDTTNIPYNLMNNSFTCAASKYQTSPIAGGSYACSTTLQTNQQYYIQCRDNPQIIEEYSFTVMQSNQTTIQTTPNNYLNISDSQFLFSLKMLQNDVVVEAQSNVLPIRMFKEEDYSCTINDKPISCQPTDLLHLGVYECQDNIDLSFAQEQFNFTLTINQNNISAAQTINFTSLEDTTINTNQTTTTIQFETNALCSFNATQTSSTPVECISGSCSQELLTSQNVSYLFECKQTQPVTQVEIVCEEKTIKQKNTMEESFVYYLDNAKKLEIIDYEPKNEINIKETELIIRTNFNKADEIVCTYQLNDSPSKVTMQQQDQNLFTSQITNLIDNENSVRVQCNDSFGSSVSKDIFIFVLPLI